MSCIWISDNQRNEAILQMEEIEYDLEEYEKQYEKIRKDNEELLAVFREDLSNLKPTTIRRHLSNVDFYINEYLLYEEPLSFDEGIYRIDDFLGWFFIRKCMWSTPASIKSTAASIKKFYKSMKDHRKIASEAYDFLCDEIKNHMPEWQALCEQYNDPEAENPFFLF